MTQTQEHNMPALRFPEFSGEWKILGLEKVVELVGGFAFPSQRMSARKTKFQVIKMSNLYAGILNLNRNASYLEYVEQNEEKFRLENDDILISLTGTVGKRDFGYTVIISDPNGLFLNQRVGMLRAIEGQSVAAYIGALAKTDRFQKQFHALAIGGTGNQANVSLVDCRKLNFHFPTLPEQQKIASFLSQVDRKIAQLGEKKALLQAYKKGMMQKLFSQELRFKDPQGHDFPDWEEKRLGELGDIVTGKTPKTSDSSLWNGEIPFITPTDIDEDTKYLRVTIRNISKTEKLRILPSGSVLFTCIASIGKMCLSTEPSVTNQQINSLSVRGPNISEFVYYALKKITPKIKATQANTTLPIINKTEFSKFVIGLPSLPEQQKIAGFLSSIDGKIDLVSTELDHAKTFKKGLLQQMFI